MASLADLLPKPKNLAPKSLENRVTQASNHLNNKSQTKINDQQSESSSSTLPPPPPYGSRVGWIPKHPSDFADGGAYPEIHMSQYPLGMGRKDNNNTTNNNQQSLRPQQTLMNYTGGGNNSSNALVSVSQQIAKQGQRQDKIVYANYTDLIEHQIDSSSLAKPSDKELESNIQDTKLALEKILQKKIGAKTNQASVDNSEDQPTFFKYSLSNGTESRIIKVSEAQVDPMEPARFALKKVPRGPPSPPVPVMHSPDKKVSKEVMEEWKIGPAISSWKNPKGYTIPLHQRLAATGKDLNSVQINDRFAKFAESLYIAENESRKDIEQRAELQKTIMIKQQEAKEEKLRQMAQRARTARFGGNANYQESEDTRDVSRRSSMVNAPDTESDSDRSADEDDEERKRNRLREERAKEHRYEKRKNKRRPGQLDDDEREISERVALGQMAASSGAFGDELDSRLINHASGLDSGFMAEDSYNIYDRPFNRGSSANQIYRPTREAMESYGGGVNDMEANLEGEGSRFTKSFRGREGDTARSSGSGPVVFERERTESQHARAPTSAPPSDSNSSKNRSGNDDDMFGLGKFMADAKEGKKRTFDHIGKSGFMRATGGSSSANPEEYRDQGSKRRKIDFRSK